jgi:hypothetical protein
MMIVGSEIALAAKSLNDLTGPWQLFVDDHLVASKTNIERRYHPFEKCSGNPVLVPDKPWEGTNVYLYGSVLPNESGAGYRMWYHALPKDHDFYRLLYATSNDGIHWDKPDLGIVEYKGSTNNNIFIRRGKRDHIPSIIHTPWEADSHRRYKMINFCGTAGGYVYAWSTDGLHWTDSPRNPVFNKGGDVGQFLWDPHKKQYIGYVKNAAQVSGMRRRSVARIATDDITSWPEPVLILTPDTFDDRWAKGVQRTHFYGLSVFVYESMYLGFLWVFRATDIEGYFDGTIFIELVSSRDGINWKRQEGDRQPILPLGAAGTWDDGMIFTTQHPLVEGDKIQLYYGGFDCTHAAKPPWHGAIGLATLRKDGFASLYATDEMGTITSKRLSGTGGELHVNYRTKGGWLQVEVLDENGNVLPGYSRTDCGPLKGDSIDQQVSWESKTKLPRGKIPVRLRFIMKNASLYSFMMGDSVKVLEETPEPILAVLYTFEKDIYRSVTDKLTKDGSQKLRIPRNLKINTEPENAAFGVNSMPVGSKYSPLNTLRIKGSSNLGRHFTLALMAKNKDNNHARLFSTYDDIGPVKTSELVFDCDPRGKKIAGLRLICKGIAVESNPVSFADGEYHHIAVTYDDGNIIFYLDGENIGKGRVPGGAPILMERDLLVGEDADHGREEQFRGYIDDLLLLGRVLTAEEIKLISHKGAASLFSKNNQAY